MYFAKYIYLHISQNNGIYLRHNSLDGYDLSKLFIYENVRSAKP